MRLNITHNMLLTFYDTSIESIIISLKQKIDRSASKKKDFT